jgi:hypothetical protein
MIGKRKSTTFKKKKGKGEKTRGGREAKAHEWTHRIM